MAFKIVIAQPVHSPVLEFLQPYGDIEMNPGPEPWSQHELAQRCADAQALMAFMTETVDQTFLKQCRNLRIIAGALKGYNNIDIDACSQRSIAVSIVPDLLTEPTAELAIGLMISVARNFNPAERHIRSGRFKGWRPRFYGGSINGSSVAVIGAGAVGQAILRMLGGFACESLYVDTQPLAEHVEAELRCRRFGLDDALAAADFVVLALHLMPSTLHMADAAFITRMKPGSYLINPARGSLVDEQAVAHALETGQLAGYGADTFEMEDWAREDRPLAVETGLIESDKTVLTPHIGSAVSAVRQAIEVSAAQSIVAIAEGRMPDWAVNKTALMA